MNITEIINQIGVAVVPVLIIIAFAVGMVAKAIKAIPDKWIPVICCIAGGIFGVLAFYVGVEGLEATEWITALAIGMASGLAATGLHQAYKQLVDNKIDYKTGYYNALDEKGVLLKRMEEQELAAMEALKQAENEDDMIQNATPANVEGADENA